MMEMKLLIENSAKYNPKNNPKNHLETLICVTELSLVGNIPNFNLTKEKIKNVLQNSPLANRNQKPVIKSIQVKVRENNFIKSIQIFI